MPTPQAVHVEATLDPTAVLQEPAAHWVQPELATATWYVPATHEVQPLVRPVPVRKVPAVHCWQTVRPVVLA